MKKTIFWTTFWSWSQWLKLNDHGGYETRSMKLIFILQRLQINRIIDSGPILIQEKPLDSIGKRLNDKKIFNFLCDFHRQGLWNMLFFKQGKSTYRLRNSEKLVLTETVAISKNTKKLFSKRWGPHLIHVIWFKTSWKTHVIRCGPI